MVQERSLQLVKNGGEKDSVKQTGKELLVVVSGNNKGVMHSLEAEDERVIIGRSSKAQIKLTDDTAASREHAELVFLGGSWIVTDLRSQNGILVNSQKVKQQRLQIGDVLVVGKTIFKLILDEELPQKIEERIRPIDKIDKVNKIDDLDPPPKGLNTNSIPKKKPNSIFMGVIVVAAIIFLLPSGEDDAEKSEKINVEENEGSKRFNEVNSELLKQISKKQKTLDKEQSKEVSSIRRRGLRELREKNYYRAITEFNHALDLNPHDAQTSFYLRKTREELDRIIQELNISATRDKESLHYQKSIVSYCAIQRLLYNYKNDQRFKESLDNINKIGELLGKEKGEISCF